MAEKMYKNAGAEAEAATAEQKNSDKKSDTDDEKKDDSIDAEFKEV